MKRFGLYLSVLLMLVTLKLSNAQEAIVQPVGVGEKMGHFTLKSYQGDEISIAALKGKNILLIFPRGKVLPNLWCPICYYQYAEIAALAKKENLHEKYDLEILYVLPYPKDSIDLWKKASAKGLKTVQNWKDPSTYKEVTDAVKNWIDFSKRFYPQDFELKNGEIELPIPVLMDEDHSVSEKMQLWTEEWGGTKAPQNMPTVFLIDKEGTVKFKYHSQYTNDRVSSKYIIDYIDKFL